MGIKGFDTFMELITKPCGNVACKQLIATSANLQNEFIKNLFKTMKQNE
jgi:hypothetical protein